MYGSDILCGISKGTFEIPPKYLTHTLKDLIFIQNWKFLDLRAHNCFWNAPRSNKQYPSWMHGFCPPTLQDDVIKWKHFLRYWPFGAGNSLITCEFPTKRPMTPSFDVFFDLRLNGRLSKQSWGWWFETPSRLLWRHSNGQPYLTLTCRVKIDPDQQSKYHSCWCCGSLRGSLCGSLRGTCSPFH